MEKSVLKFDVSVNHSKCKDCGVCVEECPNHMIKNGNSHVDHDFEFCDRCLHCYAVCPSDAIVVQENEQYQERINLDANALMSHFMYRRSYRRFVDKPLSSKDIKMLSEAATFIPSGGNDHRIELTVLTTKEIRTKLLSAIFNYYNKIKKLLKNPLLRIIAKQVGDVKVKATLKDPFYFQKIVKHIEDIKNIDDPVFYHAPAVFIIHTNRIMPTAKEDCILAAYNIVLMSETLELGSCFVSLSQQAITNDKKCKDIISIPHSHRVEAVVIVGHPKRFYKRPAYRNTKKIRLI